MINHYLYTEPYIHIGIDENNLIYYNPINKSKYTSKSLQLINLTKKINQKKNKSRVVEINNSLINNKIIKDFIKNIKQKYIGDIITIHNNKKPPVSIEQTINFSLNFSKIKELGISYETIKELEDQISEFTFFININYKEDKKYNSNQFLYNYNKNNKYSELDIELIKKMLFSISSNRRFNSINILGGNILKYSRLNYLLELLNNNPFIISYYLNYNDIIFDKNLIKVINKVDNIKSIFNIFIDPLFIGNNLNKIYNFFNKNNTCLKFIIESKIDYNKAKNFIKKHSIENFSFHPYYNRFNYIFFSKNIFLNKEDIIQFKPENKELIINKNLNENFYGKLLIFPKGKVYSNINMKSIGNLYDNQLYEIVYNEFRYNRCWLLTRKNISPCDKCCFCNFCPPISNYEIILNKYNLCNYK